MSLSKFFQCCVLTASALSMTLAASSVHAHHSFQAFDMQRTVVLEGTLIDFDLTNPHAYFTLEVLDDSGATDVWEVEAVNGSTLRRLGISDDTFALGEKLSIEVHPPRNTTRRLAAGELVTKSDGTELALSLRRAAPPKKSPIPAFATSIEGVWSGPALPNGLFTIIPKTVKESWPLTEKGSDALVDYDGSQSPSANCVPYAPPAVMLVPAPIVIEFKDQIVEIRTPNEGAIRSIFIDGRSHPKTIELSNQGHSIGHWEDATLVVDTVQFSEHRIGNAFGLPSGINKHLVERFALNSDGSRLDYSYILEDPEFLSDEVSHTTQWIYSPDSNIEILECDLEAARRFLNAY